MLLKTLPILLVAACGAATGTARPEVEPAPHASKPIERLPLSRRWPGSNDFLVLELSRSGSARCSRSRATCGGAVATSIRS